MHKGTDVFLSQGPRSLTEHDPDWEFFLPDDEEAYPDPDDFWIDLADDDTE